jgi:hypothetical protein
MVFFVDGYVLRQNIGFFVDGHVLRSGIAGCTALLLPATAALVHPCTSSYSACPYAFAMLSLIQPVG